MPVSITVKQMPSSEGSQLTLLSQLQWSCLEEPEWRPWSSRPLRPELLIITSLPCPLLPLFKLLTLMGTLKVDMGVTPLVHVNGISLLSLSLSLFSASLSLAQSD